MFSADKQIAFLVCTSLLLIQGDDRRSLLIKKGERELFLEFSDPDDTKIVVEILNKTKNDLDLSENRYQQQHEINQRLEKIIQDDCK